MIFQVLYIADYEKIAKEIANGKIVGWFPR